MDSCSSSSPLQYNNVQQRPTTPCASPAFVLVFFLLLNATAFVSLRSPFMPHLQRRSSSLSFLAAVHELDTLPSGAARRHHENQFVAANFLFPDEAAGVDHNHQRLPPPPPAGRKRSQKRSAERSRRLLELVRQSPKSMRFAARAEAVFVSRESLTVKSTDGGWRLSLMPLGGRALLYICGTGRV